MKKKELVHPRIYLNIIDKRGSVIIVEYKDNEFDSKGRRVIKEAKIDLNQYLNNFSNDFSQILDKLNNQELEKIDNYISTQYKVLDYHIKKNNYDSVKTVQDSIKLMEKFKEQLTVL